MKKKAEERISPFMKGNLSNDELEEVVRALSPQDLGEIKELFLLKIKEMESNQEALKKRLKRAECPEKIIKERLALTEANINEVRRCWHIFNNIFEERKSKKL